VKGQLRAPVITQAPSTTVAPSIVMNPTINIESRAPEPPKVAPVTVVAPAVTPKSRPNLCVESTKIGKIALEGDIWTLRPQARKVDVTLHRALMAEISNVPTDEAHTAKAALRAAIRMGYGGRVRTYSPLPWLEEYTNLVNIETGARKTVVLAVGEDKKTGTWSFVLNHRKEYYGNNAVSEMDWTNSCPIPSDLPFELLMIDMNSGAILAKFKYLWTFDASNNLPILKAID
jgi:hypothetical protein